LVLVRNNEYQLLNGNGNLNSKILWHKPGGGLGKLTAKKIPVVSYRDQL